MENKKIGTVAAAAVAVVSTSAVAAAIDYSNQ